MWRRIKPRVTGGAYHWTNLRRASLMSLYDQNLDRNPANFVALRPVSFVERSAEVFGDLAAVVHGGAATPGARRATARRGWRRRCERCGVGRGGTVSVMLANTPEMVEAHYAVPALNAVLNTLNTRLDAPLLAWQMNHCEARGADHRPRVRAGDAQALQILRESTGARRW